MIGDAYFQLRAQIGTSLFSLAKLARDLDAPPDALATLTELQAGLREPFLFVSLGESGAGKSALLNALFGREFAGDPSFMGRTAVFRHGSENRDVPLSEEVLEAERPHIFLRDFTIVDAAGFGSPAASPGVLQRFLPSADVTLFVFSPGGEAHDAWNFLSHIDRPCLRTCVFIMQQADTVPGDELMARTLALHDRLREMLGETRPIFVISAHTRAGLEKLERYLDAEVIGSHARFQKLREICKAADDLLFQLGGRTRTVADHAARKLELAGSREAVLADSRDEALRSLERDLWSLTQIFEAAQRRGGELLRRRIDQPSLWTPRITWEEALQHEVEDRVHEGVLRNVQLASERCDETLRSVWQRHTEDLAKCGAPALGEFAAGGTARVTALERAVLECDPAGVTTRQIVGHFRGSQKIFRIPAMIFAVSAVTAVVAWFTGVWFAASVVFVAVAFAGTAVAPSILRDNLANELRNLMARRREAVLSRMESELRDEIERVFAQLRSSLVALANQGTKERVASQPTLDRILQLAELFDHAIDEVEAHEARAMANAAAPASAA